MAKKVLAKGGGGGGHVPPVPPLDPLVGTVSNALLKSRYTISEGFFFSMFLNMLDKNASICDRQDLFLRKPNWYLFNCGRIKSMIFL